MSPRKFALLMKYMRFAIDMSLSIGVMYLAYQLRFQLFHETYASPKQKESYLLFAVLFAALNAYFFYDFGLYRVSRGAHWLDEWYGAVKTSAVSLFLLLALTFFYREYSFSRLTVVYAFAVAFVVLGMGRLFANRLERRLLAAGHGVKRALLVGTGGSFHSLIRKTREHPEMGYHIIGYLEEEALEQLPQIPLLGGVADAEETIRGERIDLVFIALKATHHDLVESVVDACDRLGVECKLSPDLVELMIGPRFFDNICGVPLVTVKGLRVHGMNRTLKRAMDVVAGGLTMCVMGPVMAAIAILVRLDSRGPIFYLQKRVGLDGKEFWMFKFRSMRIEAEAAGPAWSQNVDPRITRVGGILRKLSLDELPQLINVLRGEMSLVGPRPERPYFVEKFEKGIPRYLERHKVKSGMTGWAQVNGLRGNTSIEERIQYDMYYVENWSLWFDVKILIMTFFDVFWEVFRYIRPKAAKSARPPDFP